MKMASSCSQYLLDLSMYDADDEEEMTPKVVPESPIDSLNQSLFYIDLDCFDQPGYNDIATQTASCNLNFSFTPKDQSTAIICGCKGCFTWELIAPQYSDFFIQPHVVNTVDHGSSTGTKELIKNSNNDYCLAVYQHHNQECFLDTVMNQDRKNKIR